MNLRNHKVYQNQKKLKNLKGTKNEAAQESM